jgi:hypothetical protein
LSKPSGATAVAAAAPATSLENSRRESDFIWISDCEWVFALTDCVR